MDTDNGHKPDPNDHGHDDKHILVAVQTTSGRWPEHGFERIPLHQHVEPFLVRAQKELKLVGVVNWQAVVGEKILNVNQSFEGNGLCGQIVIQYGPPAGGGGRA